MKQLLSQLSLMHISARFQRPRRRQRRWRPEHELRKKWLTWHTAVTRMAFTCVTHVTSHCAALRPNFGLASADWMSAATLEGGGDERSSAGRPATAAEKYEGNAGPPELKSLVLLPLLTLLLLMLLLPPPPLLSHEGSGSASDESNIGRRIDGANDRVGNDCCCCCCCCCCC